MSESINKINNINYQNNNIKLYHSSKVEDIYKNIKIIIKNININSDDINYNTDSIFKICNELNIVFIKENEFVNNIKSKLSKIFKEINNKLIDIIIKILKKLIDKGIDFLKTNENGESVLVVIIKMFDNNTDYHDVHYDIVEYVINKINEINENNKNQIINFECNDPRYGTPLLSAIFTKNYKIVELLITNGANVNLVNNHYDTPLIWAISIKNYKIVELLINNGANIDILSLKKAEKLFNKIKNEDKDKEELKKIIELLKKNEKY